jgi:hypothetical protein
MTMAGKRARIAAAASKRKGQRRRLTV